MKTLQKVLLPLAICALVIGLIVSVTRIPFPPVFTVVLPVGVILLGLFLISRLFRKEMARFDQEQHAKLETPVHQRPPVPAQNSTRRDGARPVAATKVKEDLKLVG